MAGSELALYQDRRLIGTVDVPPGFMPVPGLLILMKEQMWKVLPDGVQVVFPGSGGMLIEAAVEQSAGIHDDTL
jgi:hypothetical protein